VNKSLLTKAIIFAILFYLLEVLVYISGLAMGPARISRKILGVISVYDLACIITFPLAYLAAKYEIRWLGQLALTLNAVLWAVVFSCMVALVNRLRRSSLAKNDQS
jgi:hypothetical protein